MEHSLLPAIAGVLTLGVALYAIAEKGLRGTNAKLLSFCTLAILTVLLHHLLLDPQFDNYNQLLAKSSLVANLLLPVALLAFASDLAAKPTERHWLTGLLVSALALATLDIALDVRGVGQASTTGLSMSSAMSRIAVGVHTAIAIARTAYVLWTQYKFATPDLRVRLRLCAAAVALFALSRTDLTAAFDEGMTSLGLLSCAMGAWLLAASHLRLSAMSQAALAATVAHEIRTPLASIRLQSDGLAQLAAEFERTRAFAAAHGYPHSECHAAAAQLMARLVRGITQQVARTNVIVELMLASSRMDQIDRTTFAVHSMRDCIDDAINSYPFARGERDRVSVMVTQDFKFHGSELLMVFVVFNLLKNSLYALRAAEKGSITIAIGARGGAPVLTFTDTGCGIPASVLPKIFDTFFTTKQAAGAGIGLAFCRQVIEAFGARMHCDSAEGQYTRFTIQFAEIAALGDTATDAVVT